MGAPVSVAVLFTDLVGSTALSSRVGPEAAEELRREHFALLREIVASHDGREVKNLGDGLMVVFQAASRALAAGARMQQVFDARNRRGTGERLEIRVGVSAGEADTDDTDFFGNPVVEAARLCAIAEGGQVLTTEMVRSFVAGRGAHEFVALGDRELKGFATSVAVLEVAWEPLTEAQRMDMTMPFPARLRPADGGVFAGRVEQQARWDDAWKLVSSGERHVWLIGGEAGIGKTSLVSHLTSQVHRDGAIVLYGRCDEDLGVPYQPWIEALSCLLAQVPDAFIAEHVTERGGVLGRLVPGLSVRTGVDVPVIADAEAERYALFGAVVDVLARGAALAPLVVVLEDLHWADKPTVQLIRHIVGVADPMRLMALATFRPTDLGASHPLTEVFGSLRRERGVDFVDLNGLGDGELLELMEAVAGHELDGDALRLRDAIAAETNGNAFFASEILRHLLETGAIAQRDGRWLTTQDLNAHALPVSVRQVVGERVARLGPDALRLLRTAAVIGRDFDLGLLAEVADIAEDDALDVLDAAVSAALVENVGPDRYSFAHALVAHTLYEDLTLSRRGRVHRRVAQALERLLGSDAAERVGELAYHWSAALVPTDAVKAIDYARQAGGRALDQLAPDEAVRWFSKALLLHAEHGGADDQHAALLVGLGEAQRQVGDPAHRETLLAAAAEACGLDNTELLVAAALSNSRGWASSTGTVDVERVAVLESALAAVGPDDTRERARLLATLVAELTFHGDLAHRRAVADDAAAIARRLDDPATLVAALIGLLSLPDRPNTEHLRWADEAIELAGRLDDPVSLAIVSASGATSAISFADRTRFDRYIAICRESSERVGQPLLVWRAMGVQAIEAMLNGDLASAERLANEILPTAVEMGYALMWYGSIVITLRAQEGRGAEIREMVASLAADPSGGSVSELARTGLLLADVQANDLATARVGFEEQARAGFRATDDQLWLTHACMNAHVCHRLGDRERAAILLDLLEPFERLVAATAAGCLFAAPTCAGMLAALLGRDDDANRYFAAALELTTGLRAPYLIATAQLEWGRALMQQARPDVDRARGLITEALGTAQELGYADIERTGLALAT